MIRGQTWDAEVVPDPDMVLVPPGDPSRPPIAASSTVAGPGSTWPASWWIGGRTGRVRGGSGVKRGSQASRRRRRGLPQSPIRSRIFPVMQAMVMPASCRVMPSWTLS